MKKIYSKQKNSKSLNILEQFWYPGHFHSSTRRSCFMTKTTYQKKLKFSIFAKKIGKNFFFQNFDFYSALTAASRAARNIMRMPKIFSWVWRSQKITFWVKLRLKSCFKLSLKFDKNRKFCFFFAIFFFKQNLQMP